MKYFIFFFTISVIFAAACNEDSGVSGNQLRIVSVSPGEIIAGSKELNVDITGNGFTSVTSVAFSADITVINLAVQSATHILVTVDVSLQAVPGPRTVSVTTATSSTHLDAAVVIQANKKPKAIFTIDPPSGTQGTLFTFDARSSSDPDGRVKKYHWDFGDGTGSTKAVAKHKFLQTGKHLVVLIVEDDATLEDSAQRSVSVAFDPATAVKQIDFVCKEFLRLFGDLENLTAEEIVVGFAKRGGCPGRQHEIDIINRHKAEGGTVFVDILQPQTEVQNLTEQSATSNLGARFYGRHEDGTTFDGIVTHYFEMVNESDGWKICNFRAQ